MRLGTTLLLIAITPGCYLAHSLSGEPEADAGAPFDATTSDVGSVDAPDATVVPGCSLVLEAELLVAVEEEGNLYAPDIFWTGERIGVVMSEDNAGGFEHGIVSMAHVNAGLTETSPRRMVGEESHGWGEAAWNGEGFGVCWSGDPDSMSATRFREVSGLDGPLGPRSNFGVGSESCLDLVFGHGRYLVAWRSRVEGSEEVLIDSLVQILTRDGERIGEPINMGRSPYPGYSPTLLVTDGGFAALANNEDGVRFVELGPLGSVAGDRRIELANAGYTTFALRDGQLALATLSGERETRTLTFRVYDAALRQLSSRLVADGAPNASRPRLLSRPEGWMLTWGEGSRPSYRAMTLSLDANGRPLAPRREVYRGFHSSYGGPSIINAEGDVYLGISHQLPDSPDYSREYTHVQRWTCSGPAGDLCRAQDATIVGSGDCSRGFLIGWRFNGAECVPLYDCDTGCTGADCGRLSTSKFACESDRRECLTPSCEDGRSIAVDVCGPVVIPSGEPAWLEVSHGGDDPCVCERPTCEVVPSGPLELTATLSYCIGEVPDCDCDFEPTRPTTECALPPLAPGTWTLRFEGREPVMITSQRGSIEPSNGCR